MFVYEINEVPDGLPEIVVGLDGEPFDLEQIAESGQCFRWQRYAPGVFVIPTSNHAAIAYAMDNRERRTKELHIIPLGRSVDYGREASYWGRYFDIGSPYSLYREAVPPEDAYLTEATRRGAGLRILRQDLFEVVISFMVSQNNNIPRIKATIAAMCQRFGAEAGHCMDGTAVYSFPRARQMVELDALQGIGLGYRDKYIASFCRNVAEGSIDLDALAHMDYEHAHRALLGIYGIGPKVADCICLFGLGKKEAFPVDTWIAKITAEHYGGAFPVELYDGFAGVIQQYMFFDAMSRKAERIAAQT